MGRSHKHRKFHPTDIHLCHFHSVIVRKSCNVTIYLIVVKRFCQQGMDLHAHKIIYFKYHMMKGMLFLRFTKTGLFHNPGSLVKLLCVKEYNINIAGFTHLGNRIVFRRSCSFQQNSVNPCIL